MTDQRKEFSCGFNGADCSELPNPEAHLRRSWRNRPAFIGSAEVQTSHIRCRASSVELEGDSTNSAALREWVPAR